VFEPTELSNKSPVLNIYWDPLKLNITGEEVAEEMGRDKPRIAVGSRTGDGRTSINITTGQMQPGNHKIVTDRLFNVLSQKRSQKTTSMATPAANLSGSWDATIEFFSSSSRHILFLEQDGNWITGSHKGDFSTRELTGTIEGDSVKLKSVDRHPADSITFIFSGAVSGDSIAGSIYMGEYRTARFTAKRTSYKRKREKITVPSGPPLAT